ncbi:MAG TPA: S8 family serine peptidase [Mycobacteriales bacterium]|nr:S8 family serine peptidase [Mycobacteriales bacterium]
MSGALRRAITLLTAAVLAGSSIGALGAAAAARPDRSDRSRPFDGAHRPDSLVVAFAPGTAAAVRAAAHRALGARVEHALAWRPVDVVALAPGTTPEAAASAYRQLPGVRTAEPNWRYAASGAPDDPGFGTEWGMHNSGQEVPGTDRRGTTDVDIDAPEGWAAAYGDGVFPSSGGTVVGVIDTGVDLDHPDLEGKVVRCASALSGSGVVTDGYCRDHGGHGTHIAGTIAARTGNGVGIAGVAPDAEIAVFKALGDDGHGFDADIVAGIRWLRTVAGARVINMSFGDSAPSSVLDEELDAAAAAGVLLVSSSGNTGDATPSYPAYHPGVVSVGAVDADGARAGFSACNDDVEVAAPGVQIVSTSPGRAYARLHGTSMAAAHVSGVAAVLMSRRGLTAIEARAALVNGAGDKGGCGSSRLVNLAGAMRADFTPPSGRPPRSATPSASPSPSSTPGPLLPSLPPLLPPSPTAAAGKGSRAG